MPPCSNMDTDTANDVVATLEVDSDPIYANHSDAPSGANGTPPDQKDGTMTLPQVSNFN